MPETGTFLSRDPVESELPYVYVRGNPITLIDPSGYCPPIESCLQDGNLNPWFPLQEMWQYAEESIWWTGEHPAQAWGLSKVSLKTFMLEDWIFERGEPEVEFSASHPITQLVMQHEGVMAARNKFIQIGCRTMAVEGSGISTYFFNKKGVQSNNTAFYHSVEGPPYVGIKIPQYEFLQKPIYNYGGPVAVEIDPLVDKEISLGGAYKFARGNIILFYEIFTASEDTPETIDGTLGSYRVEIFNNGDGTATFEVYNRTGRESFTRDYAYPSLAFFSNKTREETQSFLLFPNGWGGNFEQYIRWNEDLPDVCNCSIE